MSEQTLVTTVSIPSSRAKEFVDWQSKLNACITSFPGFISLEILSPHKGDSWTLIQRFSSSGWIESQTHLKLIEELAELVGPENIHERETSDWQNGVTELFVTQVSPDREEAFCAWVAKMHQVEATFPGFRGVYVQSPTQVRGRHWLTFLHFDTPENLDRWLASPERQRVLEESFPLIASLESHRVISPYAGWFASMGKALPSVWKQTMLVLLVLFPIVMLELKFLSLLTSSLNPSLATFIGNALSVLLIAWPLMPIAIWFLKGWLSDNSLRGNIKGVLLVSALYLLEIAVFW